MIIELVKSGVRDVKDLRDKVVDELGLCSQATFYRLINGLTERGELVKANRRDMRVYPS